MIDGIPNRPLYFHQKNIIYWWDLVFDPYIRLFYELVGRTGWTFRRARRQSNSRPNRRQCKAGFPKSGTCSGFYLRFRSVCGFPFHIEGMDFGHCLVFKPYRFRLNMSYNPQKNWNRKVIPCYFHDYLIMYHLVI